VDGEWKGFYGKTGAEERDIGIGEVNEIKNAKCKM
jgi:hypothetical protein